MKIWWPWRRKKRFVSLFEGEIPALRDLSSAQVNTLPWVEKPYAKNAPGPFYVIDGECIACGVPHALAPDLVASVEDEPHHCYFKKQPETPEEIERAIKAIGNSCCGALRYAGTDKSIKKQLKKAGAHSAIVKS